MKKMIAILSGLMVLATAGTVLAAEERVAPDDLKVIVTDDVVGAETTFRKYDPRFWDEPSTQPGTVERLDYTTTAYGEEQAAWANVYLPYGYDEANSYNIIYFIHGTNETQDSFIGEPAAKNALDNMIEMGVTEPFIMVFPTYYYDYENRAIDMEAFSAQEVRNDLMPAVESRYSTYAETTDDEGFAASRDHRAFAGYSRGSYACWHQFFHSLDRARYFMPFSAGISGPGEMTLEFSVEDEIAMLESAIDAFPDYKDEFFIYAACGGKRDMMYDIMNELIAAMVADTDYFSYGRDGEVNNLFYSLSNEIHQTLMSRFYFYNAFEVVFK